MFCVLYSVFCILYSVFCILYSVFCVLCSVVSCCVLLCPVSHVFLQHILTGHGHLQTWSPAVPEPGLVLQLVPKTTASIENMEEVEEELEEKEYKEVEEWEVEGGGRE